MGTEGLACGGSGRAGRVVSAVRDSLAGCGIILASLALCALLVVCGIEIGMRL